MNNDNMFNYILGYGKGYVAGEAGGGGGEIPTPTSLGNFNDDLKTLLNNFNKYLDDVPKSYNTYTDNAVTLYTPHTDYRYYVIQKRTNGKYRVVWLPYNNLIFQTGGGNAGIYQSKWTISLIDFDLNNLITDVNLGLYAVKSSGNAYYSTDDTTLEECVTKFLANELTYSYVSNNYLSGAADDTYVVPYSNAAVFKIGATNEVVKNLVETERISQNETIEVIS